jgi:hypothetical protein
VTDAISPSWSGSLRRRIDLKQRYTRIQCGSVWIAVLALVLWVVPPFLAHNPARHACASSAATCSSLAAETPFLAENEPQ